MAKTPKITKVTIQGGQSDAAPQPTNNAQGRYEALRQDRTPFELRAIECAKLTIPYLFPPQGHTGSTLLPTPWQGIGARGVNNLAAKMLLALMPPNAAFFRFQVDDQTLVKMTQQQGMRGLVEKALGSVERSIMTKIERDAIRVPAFEAIKQLILSGNNLCYLKPGGGMKTFRLDRYVVRRDTMGNLLEIVVCEDFSRDSLPDGIRPSLDGEPETSNSNTTSKPGDVQLYTWVRLVKNTWHVHQELEGRVIPSTIGTYPKDKSPWLPLRWTNVDNEDYGRSYVEEYLGDLKSLEALSKAVTEGATAAAKVLFLVNPNGTTNATQIAQAPNGAVRAGNANDVTVLQMEKYADFHIAKEMIEQITQRLSFAFLLNTSVQRSGERVTAEEIRFMAGELENALGGVYSILTQEFQLPLIKRIVFEMERAKLLPPLPHDIITPTITTGMEALGRGQDLSRLETFIQAIQPLGPTALARLKMGDFLTRVGTALSVDMDGLVMDDQEFQAEQQQQQQAAMAQQVAPHVVKGVSDNLKQAQANAAQAQQQAPQGPPNG